MHASDRRSPWSTADDRTPAQTGDGQSAGASGGPSAGVPQSTPSLPAIALPKGGGAIRGIDEKLTVNRPTGTASMTVAVPSTPARQGFGPTLVLSYDSGAGNGPFGLGWRLGLGAITRKTSKGLPRYDDGDVFVLSGAEDLMPATRAPAGGSEQTVGTRTYAVTAYRPRVEAGFARIERWRDQASGETHWRTISGSNVTSLYGRDAASRIADPEDPSRVFSWLLDLSYDDRGNAVTYVYKPEDDVGVPSLVNERNRTVGANRYLKEARYGNDRPYLPGVEGHTDLPQTPEDWLFRVVLDYGEHTETETDPGPDPVAAWSCRADPFSSYRSGFEIRTYRTCHRILMFHQFSELGDRGAVLVRSTDLTHSTGAPGGDATLPALTLLSAVTQTGYALTSDGPQTQSLPPVDFGYEPLAVDGEVHVVGAERVENLTGAFSTDGERWVDLDGEGLQGVLTEDDGAWYYMRNVSTWDPAGGPPAARFEPLRVMAGKPSGPAPDGSLTLTDLNGTGTLSAVSFAPPSPGWFEFDADRGWGPFREFEMTANVDFSSPDLRFVDLDGDGLADILITEDDAFTSYAWGAERGFHPADRVARTFDEERGPAVVFADETASVFLADMSGDGLADLVRIRSGEVCYWPNLGYGRFGAKVTMDGAPRFDVSDQFDARRIRLADIDGSGTADVVYLGAQATTMWFNQVGNALTTGTVLTEFPPVDPDVQAGVFDLLGTGTACLVWTSPLLADARAPLRYIDLTGGSKPYLLTQIVNNLGTTTTLTYAPSTKFYLQDRAAGTPWVTRLPFPVHVVERVQTEDSVSATRYVCTRSYHHGFYDGVEREFRGFARVDTTDVDVVAGASGDGTFTSTPPADAAGDVFELPGVLTRTWFHTGAFFGADDIAARLAREYWALDPEAPRLGRTAFSVQMPSARGADALTAEQLREASRGLSGRVLREEVYALDGGAPQQNPYVTSEHRYEVDMIQAPAGRAYGVFYVWERESLSCHYERNPADPRISHDLALAIDAYGNVIKHASVGYGRRDPGPAALPAAQTTTLISYQESRFAAADVAPDSLRISLPVDASAYQLTGIAPLPGAFLLDPDELLAALATMGDIAFQANPDGTPQRRQLSGARTLYMDARLSALPRGSVDPLGLVFQSYTLRASRSLLSAVFSPKLAASELTAVVASLLSSADDGGALVDLDGDGNLWQPSARLLYSDPSAALDPGAARASFLLPQGSTDPWGNTTTVSYDASHQMFVTATTDAVGNTARAQLNYRLCQPWLMTDPNLNRTGVRFDALGRVVATAVMGKAVSGPGGSAADEGDHLDLSSAEPSSDDDPTTRLTFDLAALPASVTTHARVRHQDPTTPWLTTVVYSDGLGRVALTKAEAEPSPGAAPYTPDGPITRWVGTGKVVYDNKGNPVKAYEPFFDSDPSYTSESALVAQGVTSITRYDPLGRAYRVDHPNGTFRTVTFGPWQSAAFDENDTVTQSAWYVARTTGPLSGVAAEGDAASKAAAHDQTPTVTDFDVLGRAYRTTSSNGAAAADQYVTTLTLDLQGRVLITNDALGRDVLHQSYDMTGAQLHHSSVDAGERWLLTDAAGGLVQAWDLRGFTFRATHDALRRPVQLLVAEGPASPRIAEQIAYGETTPNPSGLTPSPAQSANLLGAVWRQDDQVGRVTTVARDFKGNVVSGTRELLAELVEDVDWSGAPALSGEVFPALSAFDALDRVVSSTAPDGSVTRPVFNERSLLAEMSVSLPGVAAATPFVASVSYDAKAQRQSIAYANGSVSTYSYDPQTFRLTECKTVRSSDSIVLQDLTYTYDPVGNITRIGDAAQQSSFYNNQQVSPAADYTYDAIYRLIAATGREHVTGGAPSAPSWNDAATAGLPHPNDIQALSNYTESYAYDAVGNLRSVAHHAGATGWTRAYAYADPTSNRLTSTTVGAVTDAYVHDAHGNITSMPHLSLMSWDSSDRLQATASQIVNDGSPATTYYRYDAAGSRTLKLTTNQSQSIVSERVYLGDYEIYREHNPVGAITFQRDTLHVSDGASHVCLVETVTVDATAVTATTSPVAIPSTALRYQLGNHLDSALIELDDAAAVITYEEYHPYGSTSFQAGRSVAETGLKRFRFTGKERDSENGFYYHGARYYAPWLGRWTAVDPAGMVDGTSLYPYCRGNPIVAKDPSGAQSHPAPEPQPQTPPPHDGGPYGHYEERPNAGPGQPSLDYVVDRPPLPEWTMPTLSSDPHVHLDPAILEPAPINPPQYYQSAGVSEPGMANIAAAFSFTRAPGGASSIAYPFAIGAVHSGPFALELVGTPTLTGDPSLTGTGGSLMHGVHLTINPMASPTESTRHNITAYLQSGEVFGSNPPGNHSTNLDVQSALGYEAHLGGADNDHPLLSLGGGGSLTWGNFSTISPFGAAGAMPATASLSNSMTWAATVNATLSLGYYDNPAGTAAGLHASKIPLVSLFAEASGGGTGGDRVSIPGMSNPTGSNRVFGANVGALFNLRLDGGRSILGVGFSTGPRLESDTIGGLTTSGFGWGFAATVGVSLFGRPARP